MDPRLWLQSLGLLTFSLLIREIACQNQCSFPGRWQGLWYQSGLGSLTIEMRSVSKKGSCIQHYNDYYIINNSAGNCMMCLLMLERHHNIIQYKESFCVPNSRVQTICSHIQPEDVMYTLVREPTHMIQCPFHGNFRVEYTDYGQDVCVDTEADQSSVETCQDTKSLNFHFKHCSSSAALHNIDLQLECVATWTEGSEELMYGKFGGPSIASKDDSYKCFKYRKQGTDTYLAMSADATCRGLVSAQLGPVVMRLYQDDTVSPILSCVYPDWLAGRDWVDTTATYRLSVHKHKRHLVLHNDIRGTPSSSLTCLDFVPPDTGEFYFSGYFYVDSCTKRYNCIGVRKIHKSVFGLSIGHVTDNPMSAEQCREQLSGQPMEHLLMDSKIATMRGGCPLLGHYALLPGSHNCPINITVGCNGRDKMHIRPACDDYPETSFTCEHHWAEGSSINVLIKDTAENIVCYNIKERDKGLRIRSCGTGTFRAQYRTSGNIFVSKQSKCDNRTTSPSDSNHHHNRHHRPPQRQPPEKKTRPVETLPHIQPTYPYVKTQTDQPNTVFQENGVLVSTKMTTKYQPAETQQYSSGTSNSLRNPVILSHVLLMSLPVILVWLL